MAKAPPAAAATEQAPAWKPTWAYRLLTSFLLASTVGIAIGALALIDQYLQYVPVVYDGSDKRFAGRTVNIYYCMLSGGIAGSIDSRCNYAFSVAAISLAISALWAIHEAGRRRNAKPLAMFYVGSWGLPWIGAVWWFIGGVVMSIWTSASNAAGLPSAVQRNGLCAMAFIVAGLFTMLALVLMFKPDSPLATRLFGRNSKQANGAATKDAKAASPSAAAPAAPAAHVEPAAPAAPAAHVEPAAGGAWSKGPLAPTAAEKAADVV